MTIPAAFALNPAATHRLEAREHILEDSGEDVVRPGHAIGCRRTLIENPWLSVLAVSEAAFEYLKLAPAIQDLKFKSSLIQLPWQRCVWGLRHCRWSLGRDLRTGLGERRLMKFRKFTPTHDTIVKWDASTPSIYR